MPDQLQLFKKRKAKSCGCAEAAYGDDGDYAAVAGAFAVAEAEADLSPDPRGTTVRRFSGLIAPYGLPTGDGRRFADGALSSRELPVGVKWQRTDSAGHSTSVVVGRIDGIDYADEGVNAWGIIFDPDPEKLPRLAEDANEAYELLKQRVIGPSVDLDDMEFHPTGTEYADGGKQEIEVTRGRISAITLVPIPAFAEARPFALDDLDASEYAEMTAVTAAGVAQGMDTLPVAPAAEWMPTDWALFDLEDETAAAGALYASGESHLFPVAQLVDGELRLIPGAVADAVSVLAYHSDEVQLGEGTKQALRGELEALTAACGLPSPPWARTALTAAAGWSAPSAPAYDLFKDPKFTGPTPIKVRKVGDHLHYSGHVAEWGVCHIGFPGQCVTAPKSRASYAYFHTGSTEVQGPDGPTRLPTGKVTLGGGHADIRQGFQAAVAHYDDAGLAVADVRAGEDPWGIWVSGVVRPGVDGGRLSDLASAPLSGDWRQVGGGMEMVAALAVNTPGFPVIERAARSGSEFALVAAGSLTTEARQKAAQEGYALPDGSYPIRSVRELERAVQAYGRAKDKGGAKAHIIKRARALGATDKLPGGWTGGSYASGRRAGAAAAQFAELERDHRMQRRRAAAAAFV